MSIDFLIIGGGPAGMAAAIQAARLGLSVTIVERDRLGGQALAAPWVENYPGFPDGVTGKELMKFFEKQLRKRSVAVVYDGAIDIKIPPSPPLKKGGKGGFVVYTTKTRFDAKSVLLAVGLTPKQVGIPGEIPYGNPNLIEHEGKNVLVIGGGDSAFDLAWSFAKKARNVTIGMRSDNPKALPKLVERAISRNVKITSLRATAKQSHGIATAPVGPRNDLFMGFDLVISCIGKEARNPLIQKHGPGLFLAGDVCRGEDRHIAIAVGDGIAAAQAAYRYIKTTDKHR